jgi:hypothetical protein
MPKRFDAYVSIHLLQNVHPNIISSARSVQYSYYIDVP